jgi:hypothetical protein
MEHSKVQSGVHVTHVTLGGLYEVKGFMLNSKTMVEIEDIDRGKGWDERSQRYKGYTRITKNEEGRVIGTAWGRGENRCFGEVSTIHRKSLVIVKNGHGND